MFVLFQGGPWDGRRVKLTDPPDLVNVPFLEVKRPWTWKDFTYRRYVVFSHSAHNLVRVATVYSPHFTPLIDETLERFLFSRLPRRDLGQLTWGESPEAGGK